MDLLSQFNALHGVFVLVALGLGSIAVWSRRRLGPKVLAVALSGILMVAGFAALADLLGRPKPARLELLKRADQEVEVIGSDIRENEAIYLWVRTPDGSPPKSYALPWNPEMAKQLYGAKAKAEEDGRGVRMRGGLSRSDSADDVDQPMFYPDPVPALPPKQPPMLGSGGRTWGS